MSSVAKRREQAVNRGDWPAIVALLDETPLDEAGVRERLVIALKRLAPRGAVPSLQRIATNDDEGRYVRVAALDALSRIGDPAAMGAALSVLTAAPYKVRREAAGLLGTLGGDEAERALLNVLENDQQSAVRAAAAASLGRLASEKAVAPLASKLDGPENMFVRQEAALALRRIGTPTARKHLERALANAGPISRWRIRRWVETMQ